VHFNSLTVKHLFIKINVVTISGIHNCVITKLKVLDAQHEQQRKEEAGSRSGARIHTPLAATLKTK